MINIALPVALLVAVCEAGVELVALTRLTGGGTGGALAGYQERSKNTGVHCDTANTVTTPLIIRNTKHIRLKKIFNTTLYIYTSMYYTIKENIKEKLLQVLYLLINT